ncbi:hypothetical protein ABIB66_004185 [Bradyrhizobium sp. F1.13.3]
MAEHSEAAGPWDDYAGVPTTGVDPTAGPSDAHRQWNHPSPWLRPGHLALT